MHGQVVFFKPQKGQERADVDRYQLMTSVNFLPL